MGIFQYQIWPKMILGQPSWHLARLGSCCNLVTSNPQHLWWWRKTCWQHAQMGAIQDQWFRKKTQCLSGWWHDTKWFSGIPWNFTRILVVFGSFLKHVPILVLSSPWGSKICWGSIPVFVETHPRQNWPKKIFFYLEDHPHSKWLTTLVSKSPSTGLSHVCGVIPLFVPTYWPLNGILQVGWHSRTSFPCNNYPAVGTTTGIDGLSLVVTPGAVYTPRIWYLEDHPTNHGNWGHNCDPYHLVI